MCTSRYYAYQLFLCTNKERHDVWVYDFQE